MITLALVGLLIVSAGVPLRAADAPLPKGVSPRGVEMDYGPVLSYSVLAPRDPKDKRPAEKHANGDPTPPWHAGDLLATKGVVVKLPGNAAVCFDTDTCRYAAGWTGGWLDIMQSNLTRNQGPLPVIAQGTLTFTTDDAPGWAKDGSFADPRHPNSDPRLKAGEGPLPKDWAHYRGFYRDGDAVVFAYTVGGAEVLDMPGSITAEDAQIIGLTRTLRVERSGKPLSMDVCSTGLAQIDGNGRRMTLNLPDGALCVGVVGDATLSAQAEAGTRVYAELPATDKPAQFTLVIAKLTKPQAATAFPAMLARAGATMGDPMAHTKGGKPLWPQEVRTTGTVAAPDAPYVVDTVALPDNNPYKCWIKPGGFDFFANGHRVAFSTYNGDVWVGSGIDQKLDHVTWRRFAAGLYEPLGLKILNDEIYVLGRDHITHLHDLNGDGEADFYENFNNDAVCDANYHSFHYDLQADREGNFYYSVTGNQMPLAKPDSACVIKVDKYGDKHEVIATGLRAANGLGMGPNDELTVADNQGHWVPASPIYVVKPGDFYGYHGDPRRVSKAEFAQDVERRPKDDPPLCWVPYQWDNSAGGQAWASSKFGPLSGHLIHLSYGKSAMFAVLAEQVNGVWQGAAEPLGLKFDSGIMRARVNPADGSMWVCGLRGWQTNAGKDGCLQRVRYTGKTFYLPTELHVTNKGLRLTFPVALDAESARDPGAYQFEQWTFHRTETYGSDDYKVSDPDQKGRDTLDVKSATLSADGRTLTLDIPGIKPVPQYMLKCRIKAADGTPIKADLGGTINVLGQ